MANQTEQVVLLDEHLKPSGVADKAAIHTGETPLHLAFSCHISDAEGRVLVTRRALNKLTWPGVWTNSACGHPAPGEEMADAVRRRVRYELGLELEDLKLVLPDFRYRAVDASGIVENEFCPVYTALAVGEPDPKDDEVAEYRWVRPSDLQAAATAAPWAFSPWIVLQLQALEQLS
ncbi:isopentenyl-diphosphate Delta-isomerase [Arthrobacter sulfonylureivorans]|uniref:Isopentenyl-diphosphate Delta-isomerase n=1 Tax=Arthrobacter sulfonylureivorans TaxID=2486855 RepID=A0ABY3WBD0_9MICC|nr:isopentenyl-diphosphate Delta-isomerase [Arthrobacter sulfonylureivorans]UNK47680.1 isopentenyl-diphosphate Delta-isomerase [Arthrobacter sulfonylureivorans]